MFDCANVEMRELLPDLLAGRLGAAARARVEHHVASCAECASELETLRLVRSAYAASPAVDVGRIVAALPNPPGDRAVGRERARSRHWFDWRVAAALTTMTVGGLSLVVSQRLSTRSNAGRPDSVAVAKQLPPSTSESPAPGLQPSRPNDGGTSVAPRSGPGDARPKAQLSFGGGVSDLDDASIQQLLGALDEIDRAPVAPSVEPDRSPVLPVIRGTDQ